MKLSRLSIKNNSWTVVLTEWKSSTEQTQKPHRGWILTKITPKTYKLILHLIPRLPLKLIRLNKSYLLIMNVTWSHSFLRIRSKHSIKWNILSQILHLLWIKKQIWQLLVEADKNLLIILVRARTVKNCY